MKEETQIKTVAQEASAKEKMLRGSAWMTIASMLSRLLGALYIIPWYLWMGDNALTANGLYTKGYTVYSIFIMLSTVGIPSAVAKQVAHYNSLNEYSIGQRLYRRMVLFMAGLGVLMAAIMWFISPALSAGDARMIPVFRSLAVTILIIPVMSLTRGFFQGYQDMKPSAISQLVEQFARIIYLLGSTFLIMKVWHGGFQNAVVHSTFAAFVGAVFAILVLAYYRLKDRTSFHKLAQNSNHQLEISDKTLIKDLLWQAVPFIFIGIAITLYSLVDQYTFPFIMYLSSHYSTAEIDNMYALFAGNANKVVMIVVSLALAMAETSIPLLTEANTKGDQESVQKQVVEILELFFFIMLPSAFGMAAVAQPLYNVFYGYGPYGTAILKIAAFTAVTQGLFMLLANMLQGLNQNRLAIKYMLYGLVVKLILQVPLTAYLEAFGPLIATAIGLLFSSVLCYRYMKYELILDLSFLQTRINWILFASMLMFAVTATLTWGLNQVISSDNRLFSLVELVICAGVGALIYIYIMLKTRIADSALGPKVGKLRQILRIK
ncbi:putative polysaccharide biosynthesis protein [Ligilactobacillus equi]